MRLRALLLIEDIAQPSRAPAAPAAEPTSVDPPPFGVWNPKLEIPLSAGVESGCGPPDRTQQMTANQLGSVLLEYLDEHCHSPKYLVQYSSTRDQKETTAKGSNAYLSLSTNAPAATSPTTFSCKLFCIERVCARHAGHENGHSYRRKFNYPSILWQHRGPYVVCCARELGPVDQ